MSKIKRVRTGCWTCKQRLSFDVDDSRNSQILKRNSKGETVHGFRGRPRLKESLAKRASSEDCANDKLPENKVIKRQKKEEHLVQGQRESSLSPSSPESILSAETKLDAELKTSSMLSIEELTKPDFKKRVTSPKEFVIDKTGIMDEFQIFQDIFPSFASDSQFQFPTSFLSDMEAINSINSNENPPLSHFEENMMLKHFFKKLLPILDAHPSSPWPQLALKYCDFEVAKSCFIALSCIHLYETKGATEFYKTGMAHINNTMEYLIDYLKDKSSIDSEEGIIDIEKIIKKLKKQSLEKQRSNFFVILLLIHVHLLFSVLESGRSALVRTFFELFGGIVKDTTFRLYLEKIEESSALIVGLSWFDTITAVVSADCRLPFCEPSWYGDKDSTVSTFQVMGCPGEIFKVLWQFCEIRQQIKKDLISDTSLQKAFEEMKNKLYSYRDYVVYEEGPGNEEQNISKLKCTQCWTLATLLNIYKLIRPKDTESITGIVLEFISVYESLNKELPNVTQMVWPIFTIACNCETDFQKLKLTKFIDDLYEKTNMGSITSIKLIAEECWKTGKTSQQILSNKEWYGSGIDFLVV
ncbi:hypothetical protein BN7_306 [Wickerhamomyces ciferrii]|uniref:Uncharacterized protein n=1 Tax=Wickerhamomyces ciferrii (strain ATCC 14091 / BCRC 22168 / CBS 111 / JCM 3599 / NBRC 0793 / NRRL Y-1031 F-60-10) TaxID=1206466 RepID=K0KF03_WICCF|nr:uncharacterized protein BN7_306 [Wickerhamomyces ciferrii]CCH40772.1 hypothetical protein BN7_306 [Wickerhamomyces ciferrii]